MTSEESTKETVRKLKVSAQFWGGLLVGIVIQRMVLLWFNTKESMPELPAQTINLDCWIRLDGFTNEGRLYLDTTNKPVVKQLIGGWWQIRIK